MILEVISVSNFQTLFLSLQRIRYLKWTNSYFEPYNIRIDAVKPHTVMLHATADEHKPKCKTNKHQETPSSEWNFVQTFKPERRRSIYFRVYSYPETFLLFFSYFHSLSTAESSSAVRNKAFKFTGLWLCKRATPLVSSHHTEVRLLAVLLNFPLYFLKKFQYRSHGHTDTRITFYF